MLSDDSLSLTRPYYPDLLCIQLSKLMIPLQLWNMQCCWSGGDGRQNVKLNIISWADGISWWSLLQFVSNVKIQWSSHHTHQWLAEAWIMQPHMCPIWHGLVLQGYFRGSFWTVQVEAESLDFLHHFLGIGWGSCQGFLSQKKATEIAGVSQAGPKRTKSNWGEIHC